MRKITINFDSMSKIQKFKALLRKVLTSNNDNVPEISKFNLGKRFSPYSVEKIELEIKKLIGQNQLLIIAKDNLSFFAGKQAPFTKVASDSEEEAEYIVLPWNLASSNGRENLRQLLDKLPTTATGIKYTIYISSERSSHFEAGPFSELSVSGLSRHHGQPEWAEELHDQRHNKTYDKIYDQRYDESEQLVQQVQNLESRLKESSLEVPKLKDQLQQAQGLTTAQQSEIYSLHEQIARLNAQGEIIRTQKLGQSQPWTIFIPTSRAGDKTYVNCSIHAPNLNIGNMLITATGLKDKIAIYKIEGNIKMDLIARTITIEGTCATMMGR